MITAMKVQFDPHFPFTPMATVHTYTLIKNTGNVLATSQPEAYSFYVAICELSPHNLNKLQMYIKCDHMEKAAIIESICTEAAI